jgi:hypothetical protein
LLNRHTRTRLSSLAITSANMTEVSSAVDATTTFAAIAVKVALPEKLPPFDIVTV